VLDRHAIDDRAQPREGVRESRRQSTVRGIANPNSNLEVAGPTNGNVSRAARVRLEQQPTGFVRRRRKTPDTPLGHPELFRDIAGLTA
jgi:hypothetical protein